MYVKITDGLYQFYNVNEEVLKMNVPIYGTKQAAHYFYEVLVSKAKDNTAREKLDVH